MSAVNIVGSEIGISNRSALSFNVGSNNYRLVVSANVTDSLSSAARWLCKVEVFVGNSRNVLMSCSLAYVFNKMLSHRNFCLGSLAQRNSYGVTNAIG